ncbi:hypothetical protein XFF6992_280061 [Xanthomonas citri pv. fuscans]|nr:hypothetical protein XFF6992_280061 [Xanthomonas citri pv. fuscans]SOO32983.1 hypothetical protein XFF6994_2550002 [Xanthomonas citri pv. fuscans]
MRSRGTRTPQVSPRRGQRPGGRGRCTEATGAGMARADQLTGYVGPAVRVTVLSAAA